MKRDLIEQGHAYLREIGIPSENYIVSLQGPTFIFTANTKLPKEVKAKMKEMGILILGG